MNMKYFVFIVCFFCFWARTTHACSADILTDFIKDSGSKEIEHIVSAGKLNKGSSIFFYLTNDKDGHPDVIASFAAPPCKNKNIYAFDTYAYNGGVAKIQSVFFGKNGYKENLFVIVSWDYNIDGVNTVGKYYAVYAYDYKIGVINKNIKLMNLLGEGPDGFMDGKVVSYKYKKAGDVWVFLNKQK